MNMKNLKKDSEFRGLFLGEGYCAIVKYKRNTPYKDRCYHYNNFRPQMSLGQRADNKEMIEWIKNNYGGSIWIARQEDRGQGKPMFVWTTTNIEKINEICEILLESDIPSKKLVSIKIVKDYCEWKLSRGLQTKMDEEDYEKVEKWYNDCKDNHAYN
jgi:hypothetical protein